MKQSENFGFNLPEHSDAFDVEHFNQNTKEIDALLKEIENAFIKYVKNENIANNLATTVAGMVLDARQGKALNDKLEGLGEIELIDSLKGTSTSSGSTETKQIDNYVNKVSQYRYLVIAIRVTASTSGYLTVAMVPASLRFARCEYTAAGNTTQVAQSVYGITQFKTAQVNDTGLLSFYGLAGGTNMYTAELYGVI